MSRWRVRMVILERIAEHPIKRIDELLPWTSIIDLAPVSVYDLDQDQVAVRS